VSELGKVSEEAASKWQQRGATVDDGGGGRVRGVRRRLRGQLLQKKVGGGGRGPSGMGCGSSGTVFALTLELQTPMKKIQKMRNQTEVLLDDSAAVMMMLQPPPSTSASKRVQVCV
jgi:hypothetical protein